jgi:hypothetical protein
MNRALTKRLDKLEERLLPEGSPRCWRIVIWSPDGPINGPIITWRPGCSEQPTPLESLDWPQIKSSNAEQHD